MTKIKKQTKIWTTKDKQKIRICDMSDDHLVNTIKMLKRKAISERDYSICCAYGAASTLQGEMAQYYTDQEIDYLECHTDWTNYINKIYWDMCKDYERRTGNVWNDF